MTTATTPMPTTMLPPPVLPDSAPFTPAQRAWLNGFFAGLTSRGAVASPSAATMAPTAEPLVQEEQDEATPWHDPALSMEERLNLAERKPLGRKLMAAMAQLDCGACGYVCQSYADAIASGEDTDVTKCAPGGRETSKKLKELLATVPVESLTVRGKPFAPATPTPAAPQASAVTKHAAHDRKNPFRARLLRNQQLNAAGSSKDTRHIVFDLHGSGLTYKAGDALGVIPENCADTVAWILEALDASGAETVTLADGAKLDLHDALLRHLTITQATAEVVKVLASRGEGPGGRGGAECIARRRFARPAGGSRDPRPAQAVPLCTPRSARAHRGAAAHSSAAVLDQFFTRGTRRRGAPDRWRRPLPQPTRSAVQGRGIDVPR